MAFWLHSARPLGERSGAEGRNLGLYQRFYKAGDHAGAMALYVVLFNGQAAFAREAPPRRAVLADGPPRLVLVSFLMQCPGEGKADCFENNSMLERSRVAAVTAGWHAGEGFGSPF